MMKKKKKDVECLFKAIEQCFQRNNMSVPHKLAHIFRLWKTQNKKLTQLHHHPYLLSATGVRNLYYSGWDHIRSIHPSIRSNIVVAFSRAKFANNSLDYDWKSVAAGMDRKIVNILWHPRTHGDDEPYDNSEWSFLRFCRNVFAHYKKASRGSLPHHYDGVQRMLEHIYANFDCILFETLFDIGHLDVVFGK
ncbi:hypothetical protein PIB30_086208 [Stylosanthes scabra]|uniref:KEN domain-containing protein n=1 Tax=Stylosanthes scabra TaxID=79078 RepID=A0ABU6VS74_9FABA|nr:hypothetical protein [Stylosanthes scabra]